MRRFLTVFIPGVLSASVDMSDVAARAADLGLTVQQYESNMMLAGIATALLFGYAILSW